MQNFSKFGFFSLLLLISLSGHAQPAEQVENEANIGIFNDSHSSLLLAAESNLGGENKLFEKIKEVLNKKEPMVDAAGNPLLDTAGKPVQKTRLQRELDRYRIKITIGKDGEIGNYFSGTASYQLIVQPTFKEGEQQRLDVYTLGLQTDSKIVTGLEFRVTFSRIFKGKTAKKDALVARPYWLNKVPTNVNSAIEKLNTNETVRVEVSGSFGGADTLGNISNHSQSVLGLGYAREALFVADFYRLNNSKLRLRMVGLKNRGQFSLSLLGKKGLLLHFLPKKVEDALSVGIHLNVQFSDALFYDYPIDTLMVDYLFDLEQPQAIPALDEIFTNMKKVGFFALFNPIEKDEDLSQSLLKQIHQAEELSDQADQDTENKYPQPVRRFFKGRLTSNVFSVEAGAGLSLLLSGSKKSGYISTFVRKFNQHENKIEHYILESSILNYNSQSLFGRNETNYRSDLDLLVKADENKKTLELLDIVSRTEIEDKTFSRKELNYIKESVKRSLPAPLYSTSNFENYLPDQEQTNARLRYQVNFGLQGFSQIQKIDPELLWKMLYKFIKDHPYKHKMGLPINNNNGPHPTLLDLSQYTKNLAAKLYKSLNDPSLEERMKVYQQLKTIPVFQLYIVTEFLPSLLSPEESKKLMRFEADFSSDQVSLKSTKAGDNDVSSVYEAVRFLKQILDSRTLDLRSDNLANPSSVTENKGLQY